MESKKIGIVLMNLGGPTYEKAVQPFLYNLFNDEDIINFGDSFAQKILRAGNGAPQRALAKLISSKRAPDVAKDYKEINGCPNGCGGNKHCTNRQNKIISDCCSPINPLTEQQRRALEKHMKKVMPGHQVKVYTCMRYWLPFADQIMKDLEEDGIDTVVLLPLYPQFSFTTTGSSFRDWEEVKSKRYGEKGAPWHKELHIKNYHLNPHYLKALNHRIDEALEAMPAEQRAKTHLIFSAHGTPILEVDKGDPYTAEIQETREAIMAMREHKESHWISFQSRVGPLKWTQPNTEDLVIRLLKYGVKNLLMVPVAFVTDHIETLYELGVELLEDVEEYHPENILVTKGLNDHPDFIAALADESIKRLNEIGIHSQETAEA